MMVLRMVDLPEPFGPMSVTILPRCTESATSRDERLAVVADGQGIGLQITPSLRPLSVEHHIDDDRRAEDGCDGADADLGGREGRARDEVAEQAERAAAEESRPGSSKAALPDLKRDFIRCGTAMPTKEIGPAKAVTQAESTLESKISAARNARSGTPRFCA